MKENRKKDPRQFDEWLLLEYMENGSIANLIAKRREQEPGGPPPPNRILWAFWLCSKLQSYTSGSLHNEEKLKIN